MGPWLCKSGVGSGARLCEVVQVFIREGGGQLPLASISFIGWPLPPGAPDDWQLREGPPLAPSRQPPSERALQAFFPSHWLLGGGSGEGGGGGVGGLGRVLGELAEGCSGEGGCRQPPPSSIFSRGQPWNSCYTSGLLGEGCRLNFKLARAEGGGVWKKRGGRSPRSSPFHPSAREHRRASRLRFFAPPCLQRSRSVYWDWDLEEQAAYLSPCPHPHPPIV